MEGLLAKGQNPKHRLNRRTGTVLPLQQTRQARTDCSHFRKLQGITCVPKQRTRYGADSGEWQAVRTVTGRAREDDGVPRELHKGAWNDGTTAIGVVGESHGPQHIRIPYQVLSVHGVRSGPISVARRFAA